MIYNSNLKLLTDKTKTNADFGWEIKTKNELDGIVQNKDCIKESGQYIVSNYLENDINKELRLVVSLVVSTATDSDQLAYENMAEIIEYKNSIGRRITDLEVIPGNYNPENAEITEKDTGIAQRVIIMPPLGGAYSSANEELIVNSEECIIDKRKFFEEVMQ